MPLALPVGLIFAAMFGLMAWLLPPVQVIALMVGVAGGITLVRHPYWGLLLFGFLACFLPYSTVTIGIRTTVSEAILLVVWGAILLHYLFGAMQKMPPLLPPERLLRTLMLFSAFPFVIGELTVNAEGNGPTAWIRWLLNLSTLFLVPRLLGDGDKRERFVLMMLVGTLAMLVMSIPVYVKNGTATAITPILIDLGYGSIATLSDSFEAMSDRMGSPWMHPNVLGGAMAMILPLAACYGFSRQGWARVLGLAVCGLGGVALLLSGSRGALVSLVVLLGFFASRKLPYTGRVLMAGFVLGTLLVMFYPPLQDRLSTIFSPDNASTSVRFDEYANFPRAVAMFPFGIGFKVDPPVPGTDLWGISNLWLNFVYKLGVIGMLIYIAITVSWWKHTRPPQRELTLTRDNAIWLGTTGGILCALFSGVFDHYFSFTTVLIALFWLLMGINLHEAVRLKHTARPVPATPRIPQ